jgi:hypothetical protein
MLGPQIQITSKHEFPTLDEETTDKYAWAGVAS